MTTEIKKSKCLITFLEENGLKEKFDKEVRKWSPESYYTKQYDSIIGSFRFRDTEDGPAFWEKINDQYEFIIETGGIPDTNNQFTKPNLKKERLLY